MTRGLVERVQSTQESALTGEKTATRPFTGAEYLESLRDGSEVWIYGERVKDITSHPAFRNSARMIARLYDALHNPAKHDILTTETDTGSGGFTHKFFRTPRSAEAHELRNEMEKVLNQVQSCGLKKEFAAVPQP